MRCELPTSKLQSAVKIVQKALTSRAQLPILTSIKIEVTKKSCTLYATDLFLGIRVEIPINKGIEGIAIVPGKQFRELVSSLGSEQVELEKVKDQLVVRHMQSEASFSLYSIEEYPDFPKVEGDEITIQLSMLDEVEKKTFFAASSDQTRPVLTGVLMSSTSKGLDVVTTDGFRLSKIELSSQVEFPEGLHQLLVPTQSLKEVIAIAKDQGVEVIKLVASVQDKQLLFQIGEVRVFVRLLDGEYPPYQKIIPDSFTTQIWLSRDELLKHVKRALIFCQDSSSIVRLSFDEGLNISAISTTSGKYEGFMEVEKSVGKKGEIAFNGRYLLDYLGSSERETVIFEIVESLKPAVFRWPDEDGIYVVMPFRVNS